MVHAHAVGEQVGVGRVGVETVLYVLEGLEGRVPLLWIPGWKVVRVLVEIVRSGIVVICEIGGGGGVVSKSNLGSFVPFLALGLRFLIVLEGGELLVHSSIRWPGGLDS